MKKLFEQKIIMTRLTKKDLLTILNVYQNYQMKKMKNFTNISEEDLDKIYLEVAKKDLKELFNQYN
jgi:hypothetical protein